MSHNTLSNYYQTIFNMKRFHNFTIQEIENIIPFERDLYQDMILTELNKRTEREGVELPFV